MKKDLLKFFIIVCFLFSTYKCVKFILSRVPPYSVGECHISHDHPLWSIKILENHSLEAYSDVEVQFFIVKDRAKPTFDYLRKDLRERIQCP